MTTTMKKCRLKTNTPTALLAACVLASCSDPNEDLQQWATQTRNAAKAHVVPFAQPAVIPPKPYLPPKQPELNAFDPRRLKTVQTGRAPNPGRARETLESFNLTELRYAGRLKNGDKITGYVQADGLVYSVVPGNYLGTNHGKIQRITENSIVLTELVSEGGNWVFLQNELPLRGEAKSEDDGKTQAKDAAASAPEREPVPETD